MKNYITVAAFLVAGIAFANAEEISPVISFRSPSSTQSLSGLTSGSFSVVATLKASALVDYFTTHDKIREWGYVLFNTRDAASVYKLGVGFDTLSDDNTYLGATTVEAQNGYQALLNNSNFWKSYTAIGGNTTPEQINNQITWSDVTLASLTMVHNARHNTQIYLSVQTKNGEQTTFAGTQSNLKWTRSDIPAMATLNVATDFVSSVDVYNSALGADVAIAKNLAAIPEPSAFGLLAGLGAFCLVGGRRRRV